MSDKVRYWAIVPASGAGQRFGDKLPKQYQPLLQKTVVEHSLSCLLNHPDIERVVVTLAKDDTHWETLAISQHEKIVTCQGSDERYKTVYIALKKLAEFNVQRNDWVLVHDAVRPCLTQHDLQNLIKTVGHHAVGGILAVPVRDTLKKAQHDRITETVNRDNLWQAQTPQMFRYAALLNALEMAFNNQIKVTDEAMAMEQQGMQSLLVTGSPYNMKITYPEDLAMAQKILQTTANLRVGQGYDVHQFAEDRKLMLGGVEIPHTKGLLGHSDADVVLHALCDALLGAVALGDIGQHYPDTHSSNRGRNSRDFLQEIYQKVREQGYHLVNADVTIIAQAPKLAAYIPAMRECISELCEVDISQISVKATTTEKLGFIGREEGIAAQAMVLLAGNV